MDRTRRRGSADWSAAVGGDRTEPRECRNFRSGVPCRVPAAPRPRAVLPVGVGGQARGEEPVARARGRRVVVFAAVRYVTVTTPIK